MPELNGFLWTIKPKGLKPMAFLSKVKSALGVKKAGYVGALDPFAWGLMPACIGRACRFSEYFLSLPKTYVCALQFGLETDTWDITGNTTGVSERRPSTAELVSCLNKLKGDIEYPIPPLSSKKVNGKRLYHLFYEGKPITNLKGVAHVSTSLLLEVQESSQRGVEKAIVLFEVSKGTYIRGLAMKIGEIVASPCVVSDLARVRIGHISIDSGIPLEELNAGKVVCIEEALSFLPDIKVEGDEEKCLRQSGKADYFSDTDGDPSYYRIWGTQGFMGVGKISQGELVMERWW